MRWLLFLVSLVACGGRTAGSPPTPTTAGSAEAEPPATPPTDEHVLEALYPRWEIRDGAEGAKIALAPSLSPGGGGLRTAAHVDGITRLDYRAGPLFVATVDEWQSDDPTEAGWKGAHNVDLALFDPEGKLILEAPDWGAVASNVGFRVLDVACEVPGDRLVAVEHTEDLDIPRTSVSLHRFSHGRFEQVFEATTRLGGGVSVDAVQASMAGDVSPEDQPDALDATWRCEPADGVKPPAIVVEQRSLYRQAGDERNDPAAFVRRDTTVRWEWDGARFEPTKDPPSTADASTTPP